MGVKQKVGGHCPCFSLCDRPLRLILIRNADIEVAEDGVRLDLALLKAFPDTTRAFVRDAIERGCVSVVNERNGLNTPVTAKGLKLRASSRVRVRELLEKSDNLVLAEKLPANAPFPVPVCFQDDFLLAFDKPAGMPVQPLSCRESGTLMNLVCARFPECASVGDEPLMAGALHRIDAGTSGLVIVARSTDAFSEMRRQFSEQTVRKTYLALVEGSVAVGGTLENYLVHDPTVPYCRMIDAGDRRALSVEAGRACRRKAMHAVTKYAPIAHTTAGCEERTLLEVTIFTGVTHQIRAQLAHAGMHIVNDRLYGAFAVENQVGHCLHALSAAFRHPSSGVPTEIRTQEPPWARI